MKPYFVYKADILCVGCIQDIRDTLDKKGLTPPNPEDETAWDSNNYPKGPYLDAEFDTPQYCADCGGFLENDLTEEGEAYVCQWILDVLADPADKEAIERAESLVEHYEIDLQDLIRHSYRKTAKENEV